MPFTTLNLDEAAAYLHLPKQELERLASRRDIPFQWQRQQLQFRRNELRDWINHRILTQSEDLLHDYHHGINQRVESAMANEGRFLSACVFDGCALPDLDGRSRKKVLRALSEAAEATGLLGAPAEALQDLLEQREELCSTGLAGGIALPHGRVHTPYLFHENFLIIGRSSSGIPFGAPDFGLTYLFLMPCAIDDFSHMHMLSRLRLLCERTQLRQRLDEAADADEMLQVLRDEEEALILNLAKRR